MIVAVCKPGERPQLADIDQGDVRVLDYVREVIGGNVDIGSGIRTSDADLRRLQYACGEYSLLDGEPFNPVASALLNREVRGVAVVWSYNEWGESESLPDDIARQIAGES